MGEGGESENTLCILETSESAQRSSFVFIRSIFPAGGSLSQYQLLCCSCLAGWGGLEHLQVTILGCVCVNVLMFVVVNVCVCT